MSIQNVSSQVQSEELYVIRKQSEQVKESAKVSEQVQEQTQVQVTQTDTYDKANPVGEEVEGVYSVSHDESGNLTVNYKPTAKSEAKSESQKSGQSGQSEKAEGGQPAQSGGSVQAASTSSSSDDDDELEELEEQKEALKLQLSRETDESTKQALRVQLQSIEVQIALKSAN